MNAILELRERIVRSGLVKPQALDERIEQWEQLAAASRDAHSFANWLVAEAFLTPLQAETLLAGLAEPTVLGPYRLLELVARGRLGNLFRAKHEATGEPVSLKVFPGTLKLDAELFARMQREARMSIQLRHPHVVATLGIGQAGGLTYIVFEPLEGQTLAARLDRDVKLDYREACRFIRQAAEGLGYLHAEGNVHRDVQPANLWITIDGCVKLCEFGAARDALEHLDATNSGVGLTLIGGGSIVGTFDYMPPEQALDSHAADARSDIYSLGCVLYHCLTGQPPFPDSHPVRQMLRHAGEIPRAVEDLVPGLPHMLSEHVKTMLAKRPQDRFDRANDVANLLRPFVGKS